MESDSEYEDVDIEISESESSVYSEPEEEEEPEVNATEWAEIDADTNIPPPLGSFPFTGKSSLNPEIISFVHPWQYFNYFFDDDLVAKIADETNLFAAQSQQAKPSAENKWKSINSAELRIYFVIVMAMNILHKPEEKMYWSKINCIYTPFFGKMMSHRRYMSIKKYLHFTNNETYDPTTHPNPKLNKIWLVYECLNKKFQEAYTPQRYITIEESLMSYKGHLGWIHYFPMKPAILGINTFFLCESKSGYIWSFLIYTGKGKFVGEEEFKDLPVPSLVVMNLLKPLLNKGHCLTLDDYYSSVELANLLIMHNTDTYGTIRDSKKGIPGGLKYPKKVRKGYMAAQRRRKVMIMRWNNKRDVYFLSTIHGTETVELTTRGEKVIKPKVAVDYNFTMGGVDRFDPHLSNYPPPKKRGKKYYKKMFFHLMEQALWNAYVLYSKNSGSFSYQNFKLALINEYVEMYHSEELTARFGQQHTTNNVVRLTERHFVEPIPVTAKKTAPMRRCVVCCSKTNASGKRVRKESRYFCRDCDIGLCLWPCFKIYHTKSDY